MNRVPPHYLVPKGLNFWTELKGMEGNPASESLILDHAWRKNGLYNKRDESENRKKLFKFRH